MTINRDTTLEEIAALVSEALTAAEIDVVLGGGGAVTLYTNNEYMSTDLDFITIESKKRISPIVKNLGFLPRGKEYAHPDTNFFIEFPSGPVAFGDRYIEIEEIVTLNTKYGDIRIISPTHSVMDRIAWFVHGNDRQSRDQAIMVARHQTIDWEEIRLWAEAEGIDQNLIADLESAASR